MIIKGVACIRDVGCAHPGFAPYLARIHYPKIRCVHPSKWPFWLRASVPIKTLACFRLEMTLACIRVQATQNQHLDPNFGLYYQIFKQRMALTTNTIRVQVA